MDLSFSPEDIVFRDDVSRFVRENLPDEIRLKIKRGMHPSKEDQQTWQRALHKKGWGAPAWPKQHGGTGWTAMQRYIFDDVTAAETPGQSPFGIGMVGPVIYTFGNDAQKQYYLPRILSAEDWWCQGYSEPGSGSDLASLKTKAEPDGNDYIVNGQKIWITQAHEANMMFCLVRTDPQAKQQEGISFLLIEMTSPGVTVRPVITINEDHSINEVFFDDVRVPKRNRIGKENQGWTYAKFLLGHERTGVARVADSKKQLAKLKEIAKAERANGMPLVDDATFKDKLAQLEIDLMALEYTNLRALADAARGKAPGPEASLLKIRGSEISQRLAELAVESLGYYAAPFQPNRVGSNEPRIGPEYAAGLMDSFLYSRAYSIYSGTNEIQRNIIAKAVLGL